MKLIAVTAVAFALTQAAALEGQARGAARSDSETMAIIEGRGTAAPSMIKRFETALTTLDRHCSESRRSQAGTASLSDMAVKAIEVLRAEGKRVPLISFTEQWAEAATALPANGSRSCSDVAAALMVLLNR